MKTNSKRINVIYLAVKTVLSVVIFAGFFYYYSSQAQSLDSRYYFDEYAWIGRSHYFELLLKGDLSNPRWDVIHRDGDPRLSSYIFGMFIYPDYLREKHKSDGGFDMVRYLIQRNVYEQRFMNEETHNAYSGYLSNKKLFWKPSYADSKKLNDLLVTYGQNFNDTISLIFRARMASVLLSSISVVVVFLLYSKLFKSTVMGLILTLLYGLSSLIVTYGTIAYTEPLYLLLTNLILLITVYIVTSKKYPVFYTILLTVFLALLNQTKLNGVLMLIITYSLVFIKHLVKNIRLILITLFGLINIFALVYIGTNPTLYKQPLNRIIKQYEWTFMVNIDQQSDKIFENHILNSPYQRFEFINDYFTSPQHRSIRPKFLTDKEVAKVYVAIYSFLIFLGLTKSVIDIGRQKSINAVNSTVVIGVVIYISLLFYVTLAWERYLIGLVFFIVFFIGQGVSLILNTVKNSIRRK